MIQDKPSDEFLLLAATLLTSLPSVSAGRVNNSTLLQLSAIFGPMLTSALQLVDSGDVTKISLPNGRHVYQVISSTGKAYTLHTQLPALIPPFKPPNARDELGEDDQVLIETGRDNREEHIPPESPATEIEWDQAIHRRTLSIANLLQRMYCPCAGFMYNALSGEKNYLCKHLLAVLIAHQTEREFKSRVELGGVAALLSL